MIPNEWYAVFEANKLGRKPVGIKRLGEELVLWRDAAGNAVGMVNRCPHRGAKLHLGTVSQGCIQCPYHGFLFDSRGACRYVPANGGERAIPKGLHAKAWPVREKHGLIWLFWGDAREHYPEIPWFPQAPEDDANSSQQSALYDFHYARAIENAMDAHHFPCIHGAIAPNCGFAVDPMEAEWDGEEIRVTAGLKRHMDEPDEDAVMFRMKFKFPNIFYVDLTDSVWLIQVATPVDEHTTWGFVRYYQRFVTLPKIGPLISGALMRFDAVLAQNVQDVPVFSTQTPHKPGLDAGYKLIKADRGIYYYLSERERRIKAAKEQQQAKAALEAEAAT
ncbi:Rieske 2Fe-2S domain-containing protein [Enhygromyxa salina]|uniref:Methylxanthine N1-demethylase NdmA n=1 Tax=Enhygromyxa salina TaxID=215803 RepID=A0A2S9YN06_9BACT|nr:Rieske 2Fe-2S domain-containing protein [Enhygromyxa salina]PRQ06471.1 Methylxanthine N1-demethylase NdmA [Enhygromyxa salina]